MKMSCERVAEIIGAEDLRAFSDEEVTAAGEHLETCPCGAPDREFRQQYGRLISKMYAEGRVSLEDNPSDDQALQPPPEWRKRIRARLEREATSEQLARRRDSPMLIAAGKRRDHLSAIAHQFGAYAYVTDPFEPRFAGRSVTAAAEVSETHTFVTSQGLIDLTVAMVPPKPETFSQTVLAFSWSSELQGIAELAAAVLSPETGDLLTPLLPLGPAISQGQAAFSSKSVPFDPTKIRWSIALLLTPR